MEGNPLFKTWDNALDLPPFSEIKNEHFEEAILAGINEQKIELEKITDNTEEPTFENTIDALEKSGSLLSRVCSVFYNLAGAETNEEIQRIQREMSPRLAKHNNEYFSNQILYKKVKTLDGKKDSLGLTKEQELVLEGYEKAFRFSGAQLDEKDRQRISEISQKMAEICTKFSQNVLKEEAEFQLVLDDNDLEGLPDFLIKSAAATAEDLRMPGKKVITLSRSSIEPFLKFSSKRDLREKAFKAWVNRGGNSGEKDNRPLIAEIIKLRDEKAKILGFKNFSEFQLSNKMAKKPENAYNLLMQVWQQCLKKTNEERDMLQEEMTKDGYNEPLQPWDWRYYAERVRKEKYDINEADIKPYFQLDSIIQACFYTANKLFGLSFTEQKDCERYHPDVRVWNVMDETGKLTARFIGDYFGRPSKQSGAWMSSYRSQERLDSEKLPIIVNVLNLVKGGPGEPALLTFDDAQTVFHEFGHALHGMLSNVTYPSVSGTSVDGDFVELPSQLYEHWLSEPEILNKFAVHAETGESISQELIEKIEAAKNFNQGFATTEYLSCAILDLKLHEAATNESFDIDKFEAEELKKINMPAEIVMRHRPSHFLHLFSGGGYAAGYYSYMWSEVMDCDAFKAFKEVGDPFNPELAHKLKKFIYSSGGSIEPEVAYKEFRGRDPEVEALLEKRGLNEQ